MKHLSSALVGLTLAAPATADVTPQALWEDWLRTLESDGASISTGAVEEDAGRVTVRDLSLEAQTAGGGRYAVSVDRIVLAQNPDGTVAVTVSPSYPIVLTDTDDEGKTLETHLRVEHPELEMTVSDEAGARVHDFAAPLIRVVVEEALIDGEPQDLSGSLALHEAAGRYGTATSPEAQSGLSADRAEFALAGTDNEGGGRFELAYALQDLQSVNMLQVIGRETADLARELAADDSRSASLSAAATEFRIETEDGDETAVLSGTAGPATAELRVAADSLRYASEAAPATLTFEGDALPLPAVTVDLGSVAAGLTVPLLAAEAPQPYALEIAMTDVALDPGLWNMVDPAGILPRDPGRMRLDISGEMQVDRDIDARGVAGRSGGEVRSLDLNEAEIAIADAAVRATGTLDMASGSSGQELPVGEVNLILTGVAKLLERLVQVGLLPQDQVMGAQVMLGMFTRPGAAEDELVSTIRLTEDGSVYVNDQKVR